ncbi:MAG: DUF2231 domain-containing protein [Thermoanaerobaculia bacterium]
MANDAIIDTIAKQDWLDQAADPLQEAVHGVFAGEAGRAIKNLLHGTWLGHPLHPVLTDIPIGAWTVAAILDVLEAVSDREEISTAADAAIAVGIAGSLGAAVTGLTDWSDTSDKGRKVGLVHGVLNLAATGLYVTSLVMRRRNKSRGTAVGLSMLGYALCSSSAWLGGHLVFGEQIGVDHTATADAGKPKKFVAVMSAADLHEEKPTRVVAEGVAVCLVKRGKRIFAITDTCPHLGGPLSEGKLVGDAIQCPWHQSELALDDGHVVNGPTTFPARTFKTRIREGKIEVRSEEA